eukprot:522105_1
MYSAPRVDKGSFRNFRPSNNPPQQNHTQSGSNNSNLISNNASTYNAKPSQSSMLSTDAMIRKQWKVGSKVEVYSSSKNKWYEGDITRIFIDSEGEWLEVQYACGKVMRLKQIPRDDKDAIPPLTKATPINRQNPLNNNNTNINNNNNNNNNASYQGYRAPSGSLNMNNAKLSAKATISSGPTLTATATLTNNNNMLNNNDKSLEEMTQDDIDKQIRNSWVRGSRVEVYSRGRKKWMRGLVTRVFVDDEGEWLEVRYGKNLVNGMTSSLQGLNGSNGKNIENNGDIMWREIFDENGIMHQFEMSLDHKSLMSSSNGNILTKWNKINWNQKNLKIIIYHKIIRNTNCSYKSHVENIMHACGHDCHMAILLTVARILSQPKYVNKITGVIKFIFQPGEECGCGAKYMISDGILNCPLVEQIILMSGSQSFEINIIGIGWIIMVILIIHQMVVIMVYLIRYT